MFQVKVLKKSKIHNLIEVNFSSYFYKIETETEGYEGCQRTRRMNVRGVMGRETDIVGEV
jgi:hypothetical protein